MTNTAKTQIDETTRDEIISDLFPALGTAAANCDDGFDFLDALGFFTIEPHSTRFIDGLGQGRESGRVAIGFLRDAGWYFIDGDFVDTALSFRTVAHYLHGLYEARSKGRYADGERALYAL